MAKKELSNKLADYILNHESSDFYENLDNFDLRPSEKDLLRLFYNTDIEINDEILTVFKSLEDVHIYATAILYEYDN